MIFYLNPLNTQPDLTRVNYYKTEFIVSNRIQRVNPYFELYKNMTITLAPRDILQFLQFPFLSLYSKDFAPPMVGPKFVGRLLLILLTSLAGFFQYLLVSAAVSQVGLYFLIIIIPQVKILLQSWKNALDKNTEIPCLYKTCLPQKGALSYSKSSPVSAQNRSRSIVSFNEQ